MMDNLITYHSARLMEFSATAAGFLIRIIILLYRDIWKNAFYNDFLSLLFFVTLNVR